MKIIAKAYPNKNYIWIESIKDLTLEVRLEGNHIEFWETHLKDTAWLCPLRVELVKEMFPRNVRIRERPFISTENLAFYAILYRSKQKYKEIYREILKQALKPKRFKRIERKK
jgi:hypothetical protein